MKRKDEQTFERFSDCMSTWFGSWSFCMRRGSGGRMHFPSSCAKPSSLNSNSTLKISLRLLGLHESHLSSLHHSETVSAHRKTPGSLCHAHSSREPSNMHNASADACRSLSATELQFFFATKMLSSHDHNQSKLRQKGEQMIRKDC